MKQKNIIKTIMPQKKYRMKVATSIVIGRTANPNLATQAVSQACLLYTSRCV